MFVSLFQTASGSWHLPSILMASSFLIGSIVTGAFIFSQLVANRTERLKSFEKEKESQAKIIELENKTKPIPFLQSTIDEQVKKIEEKSKQVESYQQKLSEVEAKTTPRVIASDKIPAIQSELSKYRGNSIEIACLMGDQEALSFASQLQRIFASSGWSVIGINQVMDSVPIKGITITIKDKSLELKGNDIFKLLQLAGFDSRRVLKINGPPIGLLIGSK